MATLQSMAANYDRAKQTMAQGYAAGKGRATQRYSEGVAKVIGRPVNGFILQKYDTGYNPGAYADAIARTSGADVARRYAEKMGG